MNTPWYEKWQDKYLGTEDEAKGFVHWYEAELADGNISPDDNEISETDLLNSYRDTQWWTDSFLDWAWIQEADARQEDN